MNIIPFVFAIVTISINILCINCYYINDIKLYIIITFYCVASIIIIIIYYYNFTISSCKPDLFYESYNNIIAKFRT